MTEKNGGSKVGWAVALFLGGTVLTGAGAAIRGDWLGQTHAKAVEERVMTRVDGVETRIDRKLERLEDKIDQLLAR